MEMRPDASRDTGQRLLKFAEKECRGHSPLYECLARYASNDKFIVDLLTDRRLGQPPGNILLAAVQQLMLQGTEHGLRWYYPNLGGHAGRPEGAGAQLADFCRRYEQEIREIIGRRTVGTNEPARSMGLFPALLLAARALEGQRGPVHFIDVGASAGCNLMWDRYCYDYGGVVRAGNAASSLVFRCELRGSVPPTDMPLPKIGKKIGIDLEPLDASKSDDRTWLEALVWPEQRPRAKRLRRALQLLQSDPPHIIRGDAIEVLPRILDNLPTAEGAVIFHSFTVNQFSKGMRERFSSIISKRSSVRPLAKVGLEWYSSGGPELTLTTYSGGRTKEVRLATVDPHGAWLDWQ